MVTLNMESRNPMGRVYAENRSKTQKLLGVKGLMINKVTFPLVFFIYSCGWNLALVW